MTFPRLERIFLLRPVTLDGKSRAGTGQMGIDRGDGLDGGASRVEAPVFAFTTQLKKGSLDLMADGPQSAEG